MGPSLRIAVAQPLCRSRDVAANGAEHARLVARAGAEVVVFPELSLTGYELDAGPVAADDPGLETLHSACRRTGATALVGAPVPGPAGVRHLGVLAVDAREVRVVYRKVRLGDAELARFEPGPGPAVLEVAGWRLGLGMCRDTGIAEEVAATAALGIDAYVAVLAHHDQELGEQDARGVRIARAHAIPVAFASFAGATGGGYARTAGCSTVWDAGGRVLARADDRVGSLAVTTLSRETPTA